MRGCALRFSNIYGPRSFHKGSVVAHFFKQILSGEPLVVYGDGSQARDFLYVGDLVEGIRVAVDGDAVGAFQLGSGVPTTVNELLELMRSVTGRELDVAVRGLPGRRGRADLVRDRQGARRLRVRPDHLARRRPPQDLGVVPRPEREEVAP